MVFQKYFSLLFGGGGKLPFVLCITCNLLQICNSMQPSQYINTILVPKGGEIPIDFQRLAAQGIFNVVCIVLTPLSTESKWFLLLLIN